MPKGTVSSGPVAAQHFHQQCPLLPHRQTLRYLMPDMAAVNILGLKRVNPASQPCVLFKGNSPIVSHLGGGLCPPPLWRAKWGGPPARPHLEAEAWCGDTGPANGTGSRGASAGGCGQPRAMRSWLPHLLRLGFPRPLSGFSVCSWSLLRNFQ